MSKKPDTQEAQSPAFTAAAPELPDSAAAAQLRQDGHALLAALQRFNATLRAQSVGLTDDERRAGTGKLHTHEAPQLARIAHFAAAAGHEVEDAFRKACLFKGIGEEVGGERRVLARL